jgi:hypothetical protein
LVRTYDIVRHERMCPGWNGSTQTREVDVDEKIAE